MKVVWEGPETPDVWPTRILEDGSTERKDGYDESEWKPISDPALTELARRLLAERAEQAKLDEHNDKLEEEGVDPFYVVVRRVNEHQKKLDGISTILGKVHARLNGAEDDGRHNRECHATYERLLAELLSRIKKLEEGARAPERPPLTALLAIEDALVHVEAARRGWLRMNTCGSNITDHLDMAVEVLEKASAK